MVAKDFQRYSFLVLQETPSEQIIHKGPKLPTTCGDFIW